MGGVVRAAYGHSAPRVGQAVFFTWVYANALLVVCVSPMGPTHCVFMRVFLALRAIVCGSE